MFDVPFRPLVGAGRLLARFSAEGFGRNVLGASEQMAVVLAGFQPFQEIPPHAPSMDLVLAVLDGDGWVRMGEEVHHVRAGDVAVVPGGVVRGVRAGAQGMVTLHVASPPPTAGDHATGRPDLVWPEPDTAGARAAERISAEHGRLRPRLEGLGGLADELAGLDPEERRRRVAEAVGFLRGELLPHAEAEELAVYPAAETVLRARGGAVDAMVLEHGRITRLVSELEEAADDPVRAAGILHALQAVTLLHLEEEERVYLPALAGLSAEEAEELAERLGVD